MGVWGSADLQLTVKKSGRKKPAGDVCLLDAIGGDGGCEVGGTVNLQKGCSGNKTTLKIKMIIFLRTQIFFENIV